MQNRKTIMKKLFLLLLGIASIPAAFAQGGSGIDWAADLDYLARELPARHCNLFAKYDQARFETALGAIKASAGEVGNFATVLKTQQLIAKLGDSHTMLHFNQLLNRQEILPLGLLWVSDGLYVIRTTAEHKELLGHRLTAVGQAPVETVIDSLSTLFTVDNKAMVKSMVPQLFPSLQLLEYFGFAQHGQAQLTLDGEMTYTLKPFDPQRSEQVAFQPDSLPFAIANQKQLFTDRYFPEEKIYYILYNTCWGRESEAEFGSSEKAAALPSFTEFSEKAFGTLQDNPVGKIIFDMRNNGGGNSAQATAFIEKLAGFLEQHPDIKTYVVIGRKTFSSAILNTMDFKRLTDAVVVGEETAGKPNHFGEVRSFQLPGSKLRVAYSTKYFRRTDEEADTITPDVKVEMSFADFTNGVDPVYEWIEAQ